MSTLNVSSLTNVSTIKDTGGTTRLSVSNSEPVLTVGTGANTIKAKNTAKWWVAASNMATIQSSYGVASLTDQGNSAVAITLSIPTSTGTHYACGCSYDHASGLLWNSVMNYGSNPSTSAFSFRFSYADPGNGYTPRRWGAIGFGDQA